MVQMIGREMGNATMSIRNELWRYVLVFLCAVGFTLGPVQSCIYHNKISPFWLSNSCVFFNMKTHWYVAQSWATQCKPTVLLSANQQYLAGSRRVAAAGRSLLRPLQNVIPKALGIKIKTNALNPFKMLSQKIKCLLLGALRGGTLGKA